MAVLVFVYFVNLLSKTTCENGKGGDHDRKGLEMRGTEGIGGFWCGVSTSERFADKLSLSRSFSVESKMHSDLWMLQGKCYSKSNNSFQRFGSNFQLPLINRQFVNDRCHSQGLQEPALGKPSLTGNHTYEAAPLSHPRGEASMCFYLTRKISVQIRLLF